MPVDTMGFLINPDIPDHERRARREAREELPEPSVHASSVDLAAVQAQFRASASNGPVSLTRSSRMCDSAEESQAHKEDEEAVKAGEKDDEQPSGELYVVVDAEEEPPVDTADSVERAGGFGESSTPGSSERAGGFGESGTPASSEPAPESVVEPPAAPEAMSAAGLAGLGAETDTEATILRLAPANSGPAAPVAFLIHGGTVPVEVSRDVVIGRDPDARAFIGRPVATVLRVPSPQIEISRSHCAVMMTTPGSWALMDLGSANGTVLRHADGSFQDVTPMVTIALNDGDLIDVGEGTTIEFRVR